MEAATGAMPLVQHPVMPAKGASPSFYFLNIVIWRASVSLKELFIPMG
jgi:hypothetical protein